MVISYYITKILMGMLNKCLSSVFGNFSSTSFSFSYFQAHAHLQHWNVMKWKKRPTSYGQFKYYWLEI